MFFPPIFLYINKIKIPFIPNKTPPIKDSKGIKDFNPSKKSINGGQQVITKACQCLIFKSNIKVFLKIIPCVIKAVKVAKTPIKRAIETNAFGKKFLRLCKAVGSVCFPAIPNTKNTNKI